MAIVVAPPLDILSIIFNQEVCLRLQTASSENKTVCPQMIRFNVVLPDYKVRIK